MSANEAAATTLELQPRLGAALDQVNALILGKSEQVELAFACLLARGHLLIEDLPGVGKTTLAQSLAITLGVDYQRIQFTADLLPADILGVSVYRRDQERFEFHPGPIFSQLVLADEVNRATPKTQSALLEAMAEQQVTIEGRSLALPEPFFVIATQNPLDAVGTFPLPDSQLDRFLLCISLGYPSAAAERQLLTEPNRQILLEQQSAAITPEAIAALQQAALKIHISDALLDYVQALIGHTRHHPELLTGLSPRAGLALVRVASALALVRGRDYCLPEDIQAVFPALARHRLQARRGTSDTGGEPVDGTTLAARVLAEVEIP